jgi:hypothetical protein
MRLTWSVMFGVQVPLQSGSFARAAQSAGVAGVSTAPEAAGPA